MRAKVYSKRDVDKAYRDGLIKGSIDTMKDIMNISLLVLQDNYGWSKEQLQEYMKHYEYLADSLQVGYLSLGDIKQTVDDEIK